MENEKNKLVKIDDNWNNTGAKLFQHTYIRTEDRKNYTPVTAIYLQIEKEVLLVEALTTRIPSGEIPLLNKAKAMKEAKDLHYEISSNMIENADDFQAAVQTIYDSYLAGNTHDSNNEQSNVS
jgi:hypothetical protein